MLQVIDAEGCSIIDLGEVPDGTLDCLEYRSVITPDGDGFNEEFRINCLNEFPEHTLEIYNRWGQLVFKTDDYHNDWQGTNRTGSDLPEGAYFFVFEYRDTDGTVRQKKGHITVLR